ncbi:hypothetical protein ACJIZ3_019890 [Penstemon smallii]|uniref:SLH domain-containing protein n=1 Tax=Penstemon smallii TaxID=265156 RepID=A0ABD3T3R1_9LAMI
MCSSVSSPSLFPPSKKPFLFHHPFSFAFSVKPFVYKPRKPKAFLLLASTAEKNSTPELSWDKIDPDEYNGWAIAEVSPKPAKKKSLTTFVVAGIGASIAVFLGLVAYYSVSTKGFRFRYRHPESFVDSKSDTENERISSDFSLDDAEEPEGKSGGVSEAFVTTEMSDTVMEERKERVIVPLAADNAQQEAILALKKLKIIEDDAIADELCTRREYARWLLLANSRLERSRKHRIIPSAALCGSRITAFDDIEVEDPDFEHIQSLAEAGVIRSKLSDETTGLNSNGVEGKKHVKFSPERYISREDLISWKARIEYEVFPRIIEEFRCQGRI